MPNISIHACSQYQIGEEEYNFDGEIVRENLKLMISIVEDINLDSLTDIYFPYNYEEGLLEFQRKHGLKEGFTKTESHRGFGIILEYFDVNLEIKSAIFFDPTIIIGLYGIWICPEEFTDSQKNLIKSVFYHELFHAHDLSSYQQFCLKRNLDMSLYEYFYDIWSEYFAHRCTSSLFPHQSRKDLIEDATDNISYLNKTVVDNINSEKELALSLVGRSIGDLHSFDINLNELILTDLQVYSSMLRLEEHLKKMFNSYPNWIVEEVNEILILISKEFY